MKSVFLVEFELNLFYIYWEFRIKFCCVRKGFGFYFDQSERPRRNKFLTRDRFVQSQTTNRVFAVIAGSLVGQL